MPFQLMVQDRSGENLARGIEQLGSGLAGFFEALAERKRRVKEEAGVATSLRTTLKKLDADRASEYDTMGVDQLRGAFQALGLRGAMEERQQRLEMLGQQIGKMKADREREEHARVREEKAPAFFATLGRVSDGQPSVTQLQNYYENGDGTTPAPVGRWMSPIAAIARSVEETGYVPERDNTFAGIMKMLQPEGGDDVPFFSKDQIGRAIPVLKPDGEPIPGLFQSILGPRASQIVTDPTQPQRPPAEREPDLDQRARAVGQLYQALQQIENSILTWNAQNTEAKRNKRLPVPDPSQLRQYEADRDSIRRTLNMLNGSAATSGAGAPAVSRGTLDSREVLRQGREAIAAGKDPAAVKQRLRELGVDPNDL